MLITILDEQQILRQQHKSFNLSIIESKKLTLIIHIHVVWEEASSLLRI